MKAQGYTTGNSTITLSGDVSGSGTSAITATIGAAAVTYAKMQMVTAARLLGNPTGSSAAPSEITLGTNLSFAGNVLNAAGGAGTTPSATTKTTSYTATAGDLGNTLVMGGTSVTLTLPAGIFTPGKTLQVSVTASTSCAITNNTGLTMAGLQSTSLFSGSSGTFIANADGTTLNFVPGLQPPTTTGLGGVRAQAASASFFLTGVDNTGGVTRTQVGFSNLSGTARYRAGRDGGYIAAAQCSRYLWYHPDTSQYDWYGDLADIRHERNSWQLVWRSALCSGVGWSGQS